MFGKFSNGVSLFIGMVLCFVILTDSFNIQIVKTIIVIEPSYILGVVAGSLLFYTLTGLEIRVQNNFIQYLLKKIKMDVVRYVQDEDYEPPIKELSLIMLNHSFMNQIFGYVIPVVVSMGLMFSFFGKKMIVIVLFGSFLLVLLTCY